MLIYLQIVHLQLEPSVFVSYKMFYIPVIIHMRYLHSSDEASPLPRTEQIFEELNIGKLRRPSDRTTLIDGQINENSGVNTMRRHPVAISALAIFMTQV